MRASFKLIKGPRLTASKKIVVFLLAFLILFPALANKALAQIPLPVIETASVPQTISTVKDTIWKTLQKMLAKAGAIAFQQVLKTSLNKIAYDAANYVGAGATGQKPLYVADSFGDYFANIGDAAAGTFIESFANNLNWGSGGCSDKRKACEEACLKASMSTPAGPDATGQMQQRPSIIPCSNKCTVSYNSCQSGGTGGTTATGLSPSFNVCQPSSLEAKVRIGLGLVQQNAPQGPNCTASEMIQSWGDAGQNLYDKLTDYSQPGFLDNFKGYFDPTSNDLGIYMLARTDLSSKVVLTTENTKAETIAKGGWIDVRGADNKAVAPPKAGEAALTTASQVKAATFGQTTGDILVDAANVFLNQLAMSLFNNIMQSLTKKTGNTNSATDNDGSRGDRNTDDPNITYGEPQIQEITARLLQSSFGVQADYDILSQLAICPDAQNPGPTNCVIDSQFMQAATEKTTVAEAIAKGYLHGDWQLAAQTMNGNYSLRNISILRQYRILPVGWEVAVQKISALNKKVTLNDLVSCFDIGDQYKQFSSGFDSRDQAWCQGLIDPNWLITAPLNYCARQGAGYLVGQPMISPGVKGLAGTPDVLSTINITRATDYCGDQRSCIKENSDGSCAAYGYCNEEKRFWSFGDNSCDPVYNTCQTFTSTDSGGSISYLQNTLDYTGCDSNNAGCRQYSWFGDYSTSSGLVDWEANKSLYLNNKTASCDQRSEGCTSLMRIKPTWGANLVMDSDFVNDAVNASSSGPADRLNDWSHWSSGVDSKTRKATIVDAGQEPGGAPGKALKLETGAGTGQVVLGTYSNFDRPLVPDNLQIIPGQAYTLSADIYLASGDHAYVILGESADGAVATTTVKNSWQHLSVTRLPLNTYNQPDFSIHADSNSGGPVVFYIKNVKFEMSDWDTGYSPYGSYQITEKIVPPYLEETCYVDATSATKDYRFQDDAPAVCTDYARRCNQDEVGCELYTAAIDNFAVPAKVSNNDYCSKDCVGYDIYISQASYFNSPQAENMIPSTARSCAAEDVGCNEFTNLDTVNQGGEDKEYYSFLKQCIKPSQSACANFYSWAGTENGYQLVASNLKKDANNNPAATPGGAVCDETQYNLPVSDPDYNPDCQRFYNTEGQLAYRLISHTITCSDNCHTYRMSENNIDATISSGVACEAAQGYWDAAQNTCAVCLSGGAWDNNLRACTYQAIPGEGRTCSAAQNGCLEYNGPGGGNVRQAAAYDFENSLEGWYSNCISGVSLSNIANDKDGHSLKYFDNASGCSAVGDAADNNSQASRQPLIKRILASDNVAAQVNVSDRVIPGKAYNLKFLARAGADTTLKIYFYNKDNPEDQRAVYFGSAEGALTVQGGNEWGVYQANLNNLSHQVGPNEVLVITANEDFYLDGVILNEVSDRYYLIKNSSVIPNSCYYDIFGDYQGADFNLGCAQYTDRDNLTHNLHRFSQLCADSAVGCEQMIETENYSFYKSGVWNDTNGNGLCDADEPDCVTVAGDSAIYAVYDQAKSCNYADAGCSRLGEKQSTGEWQDVYLENNPNSYNQTLCEAAAVGCNAWQNTAGGLSYFKDPGNNTCVYRAASDPLVNGKNWYKTPVLRCDRDSNGQINGTEQSGPICRTTADCNAKPCINDANDYPCAVSYFETVGLGGAGNQIPTPSDAAGICSATAAGCTEYIDPVSGFMPNLVYNPGYQIASGTSIREGWGPSTNQKWNDEDLRADQQIITLTPNKLYIFSTISDQGSNPATASLKFIGAVRPLLVDNTFGTSTDILTIPVGPDKHIIFNSLSNYRILVEGGDFRRTLEVKEAVLGYQLESAIDKTSCNGLVNFDKGCVLFNERSVGSSGLSSLASGWDAYATGYNQAPVACDSQQDGSCTANQLIKVSPERSCGKWLDCLTYVQDPVTQEQTCYAIGQCNRLNDKGECANFENTPETARTFNPSSDKNTTGYSLIGNYYFDQMEEVGLNSAAHFDFEDSVPALSCKKATPGGGACNFNQNIVKDSLVREPEGTPTDYPAHGKSFLKVPASYLISPQSADSRISLVRNKEYFLNVLINTKNSGVGAKIIIEGDKTTNLTKTFTGQANNGWERKIYSFTTPAGTGPANINIYLGSDSPTEDGYVYFDDINIEPVLEVAPQQYIARECRLYPTDDSLTCVNKNDNVINNGWEGYCLQHDLNNPKNCLLWYPVDYISSARTTSPSLGYQGKSPLNYCTELNGNFSLVEKRKPFYITSHDDEGWCSHVDNNGFYPPKEDTEGVFSVCGSDYIGFRYSYSYTNEGNNHHCNTDYWCVPKQTYITVKVEEKKGEANPYDFVWSTSLNGVYISEAAIHSKVDENYSEGAKREDKNDGWRQNRILAVNASGWYVHDGVDANGKELEFADPAIRVYDYNSPPADEEGLKLLSGSDPEKIYRLTCNQFTQTVDGSGLNSAWTARTGINSPDTTTTPPYFVNQNVFYAATSTPSFSLTSYGRNREAVPFGAATWPDDFDLLSSEPIKFRDQYSKKNNEEIFAGRPYGCSDMASSTAGCGAATPCSNGCSNIGYCSLDPNVFCLTSASSSPLYNIAKMTCGSGGYGQCIPLWKNHSLSGEVAGGDFEKILKTIFLRSYNAYEYLYDTVNSYLPAMANYNRIGDIQTNQCQGNIRPLASYSSFPSSAASFCSVRPTVNNVKLKLNNVVVPGSSVFDITSKGIYRLEFNTAVDKEQQPLREIRIDWDDGSPIQVIIGQDQHPGVSAPHIFYHYYRQPKANTRIKIEAHDNWGLYGANPS